MKLAKAITIQVVMVLICLGIALNVHAETLYPSYAPDSASGNYFGKSLDIDGDTAIVGSPEDDPKGGNSGSAYIMIRAGNGWIQKQKLTASDGALNDLFGSSVSISGNYAIVGAPANDGIGTDAGAAYVFFYNGTHWAQQQKLFANDAAVGDHFGTSVAISGDYIIVGSPDDDNYRGAAYIFKRAVSNWSQQTKLQLAIRDSYEYYGKAVSISGNFAIVGVKGANSSQGAAYVYQRNATTWSEMVNLPAGTLAQGDNFGTSVDIYSNANTAKYHAIVGAIQSYSKGFALLFSYNGSAWTLTQTLTASDGVLGDYYGNSVSLSEELAIIGAYRHGSTGAAYTYGFDGTAWNNETKLIPEMGAANDDFGYAVTVSALLNGSSIIGYASVIGAYRNDDSALNAGAIYGSNSGTDTGFDFPPTISGIPNQFTGMAIPFDVDFTVGDVEEGILTVTASSDNQAIVDNANITINGLDANNQVTVSAVGYVSLSMTIIPASQSGSATITVTVTDAKANSNQSIFTVGVRQPPSISNIPDQIMVQNTSLGPIGFTVNYGDVQTGNLILSAASSNPSLISVSNIVFGGAGTDTDRTVTLTPSTGAAGETTITVTVTDSEGYNSKDAFTVKVNGLPQVSVISQITTKENIRPPDTNFTIQDEDAGLVDITVRSSNQELVPDDKLEIFYDSVNQGNTATILLEADTPVTLQLRITPASYKYGSAVITLQVADANNGTTTKYITLNVTNEPDAPSISSQSDTLIPIPNQQVNEDGTLSFNFYVSDMDGGNVTIESVTSSNQGLIPQSLANMNINNVLPPLTVTLDEASKTKDILLTLAPVANANSENQFGDTEIAITVRDPSGKQASQSFMVHVNPVNDSPGVSIADQTMNEDDFPSIANPIPLTISDVDGDDLKVSFKSNNTTVITDEKITLDGFTAPYVIPKSSYNAGSLNLTIKPEANQHTANSGPVTIDVTVVDIKASEADSLTKTTSFAITVDPQNDPPSVGMVDSPPYTMMEDVTKTFLFEADDADSDDLKLKVESSDVGIVKIDSDHIKINGLAYTEGMTLTKASYSTNIKLTIKPIENAYTEPSDPVIISISITDAGDIIRRTSFDLSINPVNDAPTIGSIDDKTMNEDDIPATINPLKISVNDVEAQSLTIKIESSDPTIVSVNTMLINNRAYNPLNSFVIQSSEYQSGPLDLIIKPAKDKNTFNQNPILITVTISDGEKENVETFNLTVTPINDNPTIVKSSGQIWTMNEDELKTFSFDANDVDLDDLTVSMTSSDQSIMPIKAENIKINGQAYSTSFTMTSSVYGTSPLKITVTPEKNAYGTVTIYVTVKDPSGKTGTENFALTINPVNDAPEIDPIEPQTINEDNNPVVNPIPITLRDAEDQELTITITSSNESIVHPDKDPIADPAKYYIFVNNKPYDVSMTILSSEYNSGPLNLVIIPLKDQNTGGINPVAMTITADDGEFETSQIFNLTVTPVNDVPTIVKRSGQTWTMNEDELKTFSFDANDVDADDLTVSMTSSDQTIVPIKAENIKINGQDYSTSFTMTSSVYRSSPLKITVTPEKNAHGTVTLYVTVKDPSGKTGTENFTLTIEPVNDAPEIDPIEPQIINEDNYPAVNPIQITVRDVDQNQDLTITITSSNTSIVLPDKDPVADPAKYYVFVNNKPYYLKEDGTSSITLPPSEYDSGPLNLVIIPLADKNTGGINPILMTVKASDGELETFQTFNLTVTPVNDPPSVEPSTPVGIMKEDETKSFFFQVNDPEGDTLTISLVSSDLNIIPIKPENIKINGQDYSESFSVAGSIYKNSLINITVTPAANAFTPENEPVRLYMTVKDIDASATQYMSITITPENDLPEIEPIENKTMNEDDTPSTINPIYIQVNDQEKDDLTISAKSSNTTIIPNNNITLNGYALPYTFTKSQYDGIPLRLTIKPAPEKNTGSSDPVIITLTLDDIVIEEPVNLNTVTTFTVQVTPVNDPPTIAAIASQEMNEDESKTVPFTVNDIDKDDLAITLTSTNPNIAPADETHIKINGRAYKEPFTIQQAEYANPMNLIVTPVKDANTLVSGPVTITITVTDAANVTRAQAFLLKILPVNDMPTISPVESKTTHEDVELTVEVTINDVDNDPITIDAKSSNLIVIPKGYIKVNGFQTPYTVPDVSEPVKLNLTIKPAKDQNTPVNPVLITLTASDGVEGYTPTSMSFNVTVTPVNDAPVITLVQTKSITEDSQNNRISFTVFDADGDIITPSAKSGNLELIPDNFPNLYVDGTESPFTLVVIPKANANSSELGTAEITVEVSDGTVTGTGKVVIEVTPVNDPPVFSGLSPNETINEDETKEFSFKMEDIDGDTVSVTAKSVNTALVQDSYPYVYVSGTGTDRKLVIKPKKDANSDQFGVSNIILTAKDGKATVTHTLTLTVAPVNDPPIITDLPLSADVDEDSTYTKEFKVNDVDGDTLTVTVNSSNELLVPNNTNRLNVTGIDANRLLTIRPLKDANTDLNGVADIQVTVSDGTETTTAKLTITVNAVNDAPIISGLSDILTILEDSDEKQLQFKIFDVDQDIFTATVQSSNTKVIPNDPAFRSITGTGADWTLKLTPKPDESGDTDILIIVDDNSGSLNSKATHTINVHVTPVNDDPVISGIYDKVYIKEKESKILNFSISDPDNDLVNLDVQALSLNDKLIPNNEAYLKWEPLNPPVANLNYQLRITPKTDTGETMSQIKIAVDDRVGGTAEIVFDVEVVANPNEPQIWITSALDMYEDTPATVKFKIFDPKVAVADLDVIPFSSNTAAVPNGDHLIPSLLPEVDAYGNNYQIKIVPAKDFPMTVEKPEDAQTLITISVNNGEFVTQGELLVTIHPINDSPEISPLPKRIVTVENTAIKTHFNVSDVETSLNDIYVSVNYKSPTDTSLALLPAGNIILTCADGICTLELIPGLNKSGETILSVKADDRSGSTSAPSIVTQDVIFQVGVVVLDGDVNFDGSVDLKDVILGLQVITGIPVEGIRIGSDVNSNGKIGIHEVIFILQYVAGIR